MFTGIVEEVGKVVSIQHGASSARLTIEAVICSQETRLGDSISINGCCLTVVGISGSNLSFDAVPETMKRTSLGKLSAGSGVNLERALAVGSRLGGHFVQGHVDGTGTLVSVTVNDNAHILRIGAPSNLLHYLIEKGSVALDGISLTVAEVNNDYFSVWIIPHTFANTTLGSRRVGDSLNVEVDLLAKYVEKLISGQKQNAGITIETLVNAGYATGE